MVKAIELDEIIDTLESISSDIHVYLDVVTGRFITVIEDAIRAVDHESEAVDELPEWQQQSRNQAKSIVEDNDGRYLQLPTEVDIHDWNIMRSFFRALDDAEISSSVLIQHTFPKPLNSSNR